MGLWDNSFYSFLCCSLFAGCFSLVSPWCAVHMRSLLKCAERYAGGALPDAPASSHLGGKQQAGNWKLHQLSLSFWLVWANQQAFSERSCATGRAQQGAWKRPRQWLYRAGHQKYPRKRSLCLATTRGNEFLTNLLCNFSCWPVHFSWSGRVPAFGILQEMGFIAVSTSSWKKVICTGLVQRSFL